jgi:hypothetical protein
MYRCIAPSLGPGPLFSASGCLQVPQTVHHLWRF